MRRSSSAVTALLALATPLTAQDQLPLVPCDGTYRAVSGQVTMNAAGMTVPGRGAEEMGTETLSVADCGRSFSFDLQGRLQFLQSVMNEREYVADVPGGYGVRRTMTFVLDDNGALSGGMKATDGGLLVERPLALIPVMVSMPDLEGCADDQEPALPDRGMGPGEGPLQDAIQARGMAPPAESGFSFADYTTGNGSSDSLNYEATVQLSAKGDVLPRLEELGSRQELICGGEALEPPRYLLSVKMNEVEGDTFVFIRIIEIETSRIVEQREAVVSGTDRGTIADGIGDA